MTGPALVVERAGLLTSVQDLGRHGHQRLGVPVSGVLDPLALRLANRLVGNPEEAAGLELLVAGPALRVEAARVRVAVIGGGRDALVTVDGAAVPPGRSVTVARGGVIAVAALPGRSAVLAVAGGLDLPSVLGSLSTCLKSAFGGLEGRALRAGDRLALCLDDAGDGPDLSAPPLPRDDGPVRVVPGPQDDAFTAAALAALAAGPFTLTAECDRMGARLAGPALPHRDDYNIVSDGIVGGSVQVPGTGQPIVLLADRQTVGGYPKIATVISADLRRFAYLGPGDAVRFAPVAAAEAVALRRAQEQAFAALLAGIAPAPPAGGVPDSATLLAANLISGVIRGDEPERGAAGIAMPSHREPWRP